MQAVFPQWATVNPGEQLPCSVEGRDNEGFSRPRLSQLLGVLHFSFKMSVLVSLFWGGMLLPVVSAYQKRPLKSYPALPLDVVCCTCTILNRNLSACGFLGWLLFTKPLRILKCKFSPSNFSLSLFLRMRRKDLMCELSVANPGRQKEKAGK